MKGNVYVAHITPVYYRCDDKLYL